MTSGSALASHEPAITGPLAWSWSKELGSEPSLAVTLGTPQFECADARHEAVAVARAIHGPTRCPLARLVPS